MRRRPLNSPAKRAAYLAGELAQPTIEHLTSPTKQLPKKSGGVSISQGNKVAVINLGRPGKQKPPHAPAPAPASTPQPDFHTDLSQMAHSGGGGVRKRAKQYEKWASIMPQLVDAYLALLRETESLHNTANLCLGPGSTCGCHKRVLHLTVIRFTGASGLSPIQSPANRNAALEEAVVNTCRCPGATAPEQLIRAGLFPCSPTNPTLAVDINLLSFFRELFLHIAPNNTALCKTIESFLAFRGYQLELGQRLRIRFGNAYTWYTSLYYSARKRVDDAVSEPEPELPQSISPPTPSPEPTMSPNKSASKPKTGSKRARCESVDDEDDEPQPGPKNPFPEPPPRTQPSAYLRERCPACFEGLERDATQVFDVSVCIDACFTQKIQALFGRNFDPARVHAYSVFIERELARRL
ncbi:CxC2 domain-containing protein [Mycena kentingensis (nom. inval.)]|nr:CxC2 domain-containing protein [Mycena kentingensis (nom. inval.)]